MTCSLCPPPPLRCHACDAAAAMKRRADREWLLLVSVFALLVAAAVARAALGGAP